MFAQLAAEPSAELLDKRWSVTLDLLAAQASQIHEPLGDILKYDFIHAWPCPLLDHDPSFCGCLLQMATVHSGEVDSVCDPHAISQQVAVATVIYEVS